jgi:hypothetical protein
MGSIGRGPPPKGEKVATVNVDIVDSSNQIGRIESIVCHHATQKITTEESCFTDISCEFIVTSPVIFSAEIVQQ